MWGRVWEPKATLPPHYDFCTFLNMVKGVGGLESWPLWNGDGDFTFNITPLWEAIYPNGTDDRDFWNHGWVKGQPEGWPDAPVETIAKLYETHNLDTGGTYFHCETPMFGRENGPYECVEAPRNLLPAGTNSQGGVFSSTGARSTASSTSRTPTTSIPATFGSGSGRTASSSSSFDRARPSLASPAWLLSTLGTTIQRRRFIPSTRSTSSRTSSSASTGYAQRRLARLRKRHLLRPPARLDDLVARPEPRPGPLFRERVPRNDRQHERRGRGAVGRCSHGAGGVLSGGTLALEGDKRPDAQCATAFVRTSESAPFGSWRWSKIYDSSGVPVGRHGTEPPAAGSMD
jgi:hypothetical protein